MLATRVDEDDAAVFGTAMLDESSRQQRGWRLESVSPIFGGLLITRGWGYPAVIVPNSPWDSPSGPAVKNSVVVGPLFWVPLPNWSDQRPSIVTTWWLPVRSWPT